MVNSHVDNHPFKQDFLTRIEKGLILFELHHGKPFTSQAYHINVSNTYALA